MTMAILGLACRFVRIGVIERPAFVQYGRNFQQSHIIAPYRKWDLATTVLPVCNYESRRSKHKDPPTKVIDFSYTGDKYQGPAPIDLSLPRKGYENLMDLVDDPNLKRVFTLEFADEDERRDYRYRTIMDTVRKYSTDPNSPEEKLIKMTLKMRCQMKHVLRVRKDNQAKHHILCRYNRRRKMIEELRQTDYESYVWIMEGFGLTLPTRKRLTHLGRSRRAKRQRAAHEQFRAIRREKMIEIREKIAQERESFEMVKQKQLKEIYAEMKDLGIRLDTNLDRTLEKLGVKRIHPVKLKRKERKQRKFRPLMEKFGKIKQMEKIRELPAELIEE